MRGEGTPAQVAAVLMALRVKGETAMADGRVPLTDAAWRQRTLLLVGLAVAVVLAMSLVKPIPQPPEYHGFKDARSFLGIPNVLNVVSNLPFLIIGALGLRWALSGPSGGRRSRPRLRRWQMHGRCWRRCR